jgi:hypothetical protein
MEEYIPSLGSRWMGLVYAFVTCAMVPAPSLGLAEATRSTEASRERLAEDDDDDDDDASANRRSSSFWGGGKLKAEAKEGDVKEPASSCGCSDVATASSARRNILRDESRSPEWKHDAPLLLRAAMALITGVDDMVDVQGAALVVGVGRALKKWFETPRA